MEASRSSNSKESKTVYLDKLKALRFQLRIAMEFDMNWLASKMNAAGILSEDNYEIVSQVRSNYEKKDKAELMVSDFVKKARLNPQNVRKLLNIMKENFKQYEEAIGFLEEICHQPTFSKIGDSRYRRYRSEGSTIDEEGKYESDRETFTGKDKNRRSSEEVQQCQEQSQPILHSSTQLAKKISNSDFKKLNNFTTGKIIRLKGVATDSGRFSVNIFNAHRPDDIIFHFNPRFDDKCVVRNSRIQGIWGAEERDGGMVFTPGEEFSISIFVEPKVFRVQVDGKFFCEYNHRYGVPNLVLLEFDCGVEYN